MNHQINLMLKNHMILQRNDRFRGGRNLRTLEYKLDKIGSKLEWMEQQERFKKHGEYSGYKLSITYKTDFKPNKGFFWTVKELDKSLIDVFKNDLIKEVEEMFETDKEKLKLIPKGFSKNSWWNIANYLTEPKYKFDIRLSTLPEEYEISFNIHGWYPYEDISDLTDTIKRIKNFRIN